MCHSLRLLGDGDKYLNCNTYKHTTRHERKLADRENNGYSVSKKKKTIEITEDLLAFWGRRAAYLNVETKYTVASRYP
jgi:hypothetical protein